MIELKTLKELPIEVFWETPKTSLYSPVFVKVKDLKAEAVKIHNLEKESKNVKEFIRWFFNLTEKDLEEEK